MCCAVLCEAIVKRWPSGEGLTLSSPHPSGNMRRVTSDAEGTALRLRLRAVRPKLGSEPRAAQTGPGGATSPADVN